MNIMEFLSQPLCQSLALTLVHFLWQGLIVMSLVLLFFRFFKIKQSNVRYFIYLSALIAMMACPAITFLALNIPIEKSINIAAPLENNEAIEFTEPTYSESVTAPLSVDLPKNETTISRESKSISAKQKQSITELFHLSLPWLLATWITGVFILSLRLLIGFIGVYRCRRNCKPIPERLLNSIRQISNKLGMKDFSRVFISNRIVNAIAIGYLRPIVLIPASMLTKLTPEMLEAVIAHELAHIRRFDLWINLIQRIAETMLFYHPAVWWLSSHIRTEREFCCDELAVKVTGQRLSYASALESAGRISIMPKQLAFAEGFGRDKKTLLKRVQYILGLTPAQKNNSSWISSIVTISLITLIIVSSALCFTEKASGDFDTEKNVPEYVQQLEVVVQKWLNACENNNIEQAKTLLMERESSSPEQLMQIGKMISNSIGNDTIIPVKVAKVESDKMNGAFLIATTVNGFSLNGNPSYIASFVHKVENKWLIESLTYSDQETADRTFDSIQKNYPDKHTIWEKDTYTTLEELKNTILKNKLQTLEKNEWKQLDDASNEAKEIASIVRKWVSAGLRNDIKAFMELYTSPKQRFAESYLEQFQQISLASPDWLFSPMIIRKSESVAEIVSNSFVIKTYIPEYDNMTLVMNIQLKKVDGNWGISGFSNQKIKEASNSNFESKYPDAQTWVDTSISDGLNPLQKTEVNTNEKDISLITQLISSAKEGSVVTLPKGTYKVPVSINKNITLKGEDLDNCIIEVTNNGPAINIDTKGAGKVTLENITIKWQLATSDQCELPYAVFIKDSEVIISKCSFVPLGNDQRCPVALRASGFSNMKVNNCKFEGFNYTVQYGEGTEGAFNYSIVTNSGHQGVTLYEGAKATITNNIIAGSKYHGLRSTGGELDVRNNLIIQNKNRGIYLGNKPASGTIENNVIIGNGTGISSFAQSKVSIQNNVITDNGYSGIDMRDSCKLSIRDNIINGNERGLALFEESGTNTNQIYRNTFWQNKIETENISKSNDSIIADPLFNDAEHGDFSLKAGRARDTKQGLNEHVIFLSLWNRWENREDKSWFSIQVIDENKLPAKVLLEADVITIKQPISVINDFIEKELGTNEPFIEDMTEEQIRKFKEWSVSFPGTNILSNQKLVAYEGKSVTIDSKTQTDYLLEPLLVNGVFVKFIPYVDDNESSITLEMAVENSKLRERPNESGNDLPSVTRRTTSTKIRIETEKYILLSISSMIYSSMPSESEEQMILLLKANVLEKTENKQS